MTDSVRGEYEDWARRARGAAALRRRNFRKVEDTLNVVRKVHSYDPELARSIAALPRRGAMPLRDAERLILESKLDMEQEDPIKKDGSRSFSMQGKLREYVEEAKGFAFSRRNFLDCHIGEFSGRSIDTVPSDSDFDLPSYRRAPTLKFPHRGVRWDQLDWRHELQSRPKDLRRVELSNGAERVGVSVRSLVFRYEYGSMRAGERLHMKCLNPICLNPKHMTRDRDLKIQPTWEVTRMILNTVRRNNLFDFLDCNKHQTAPTPQYLRFVAEISKLSGLTPYGVCSVLGWSVPMDSPVERVFFRYRGDKWRIRTELPLEFWPYWEFPEGEFE